MLTSFDKLKGLACETQSGELIGKVHSVVLDVQTHSVHQYEVRHGHLASRKTFLIHVSQVISISSDRMVVKDDAVSKESKEEQSVHKKKQQVLEGAMPSETS